MPKPVKKSEQDLRETAIMNAVRAQVDEVVKDYRLRMLNILPEVIEQYRQRVKQTGVLPPIDEEFRSTLREMVAQHNNELEASYAR